MLVRFLAARGIAGACRWDWRKFSAAVPGPLAYTAQSEVEALRAARLRAS